MSKTLTKSDIIDSVVHGNGFPRKMASDIVDIFLETIKRSLESGEDVLISGLGKCCVKNKTERKGRNPATGDAMAA